MKSFKEFINEKFDYRKQKSINYKNYNSFCDVKIGDVIYFCNYEKENSIQELRIKKITTVNSLVYSLKINNDDNLGISFYFHDKHEKYPIHSCCLIIDGKFYNGIASTNKDLLVEFMNGYKKDIIAYGKNPTKFVTEFLLNNDYMSFVSEKFDYTKQKNKDVTKADSVNNIKVGDEIYYCGNDKKIMWGTVKNIKWKLHDYVFYLDDGDEVIMKNGIENTRLSKISPILFCRCYIKGEEVLSGTVSVDYDILKGFNESDKYNIPDYLRSIDFRF